MAYEYDRFEREEGGGSFLMGLLAGTVLGAGLGMLFAPKAGSELRSQIGSQVADQTGKIREAAEPYYQQATEKVSQIVDRGPRGLRSRALERQQHGGGRARPRRRPVRPGELRRHDEHAGRRLRRRSVTEQQARTTANVVMAAAALGAAVIVLRIAEAPAHRLAAGAPVRDRARWRPGRPATVRDAWDGSAAAAHRLDRRRAAGGRARGQVGRR